MWNHLNRVIGKARIFFWSYANRSLLAFIMKCHFFLFAVNEVKVSDGEKGCDRAALIFKCTVENAPKVSNTQYTISCVDTTSSTCETKMLMTSYTKC